MTKTSAIFGVVSVLTAAIVGGVFIRKKIIDDALYWKAFAEFEENRKKQMKIVEENIKEINKSLNKTQYEKQNLSKKIDKYSENIEILVKDIVRHKEKIEELQVQTITLERSSRILADFERYKKLEFKAAIAKSQIEGLNKKLENFNKNNNQQEEKILFQIQKLNKTISDWQEMVKNKKQIIDNYVFEKHRSHYQLENHKNIKSQQEEQIKEMKKKKKQDSELLLKIFSTIELLEDALNKKELELKILQTQNFSMNFK